MQKNRVNQAKHAQHDEHAGTKARQHLGTAPGEPAATGSAALPVGRYEHLAADLDDLADVPTEVLADWVAARGRCLWETTFGDPPDWFLEAEQPAARVQ